MPFSSPPLPWLRPGYHRAVFDGPVICDDWNFTLSAFLRSVTVAGLTATGEGQTVNDHVEACFRSAVSS